MNELSIEQTRNILQNLTNLEISYIEYSKSPKDFGKYQNFLEYFNNYIIKSKKLYRFYFPADLTNETIPSTKKISDLGEITDSMNILPGYNFSVAKYFNFPNALRHKCNYFSLIYLFEGNGELTLDKKTFQMQKGDFYLIPPAVYYAVQLTLDSLCICFNLRQSFVAAEYKNIFHEDPLITQFITSSLAPEHTMTYLLLRTTNSKMIYTLAFSIFTEYINQSKHSNNVMKNLLSLMFAIILRDDKTIMDASIKTTKLDQQYQAIINYLKQYYQTADLSSLAEYIHFSKQYICRIVKEKTGDTFNTLLIKIRLEMVEQYLLESQLTLETISDLCGFTTPSHLSRIFKKHYGMSPSQYRKEHQA